MFFKKYSYDRDLDGDEKQNDMVVANLSTDDVAASSRTLHKVNTLDYRFRFF